MDEDDKNKMLHKLVAMKKELARKQKKLERAKRSASAKEHVRRKIREHQEMACSNQSINAHTEQASKQTDTPEESKLLSPCFMSSGCKQTPSRNVKGNQQNTSQVCEKSYQGIEDLQSITGIQPSTNCNSDADYLHEKGNVLVDGEKNIDYSRSDKVKEFLSTSSKSCHEQTDPAGDGPIILEYRKTQSLSAAEDRPIILEYRKTQSLSAAEVERMKDVNKSTKYEDCVEATSVTSEQKLSLNSTFTIFDNESVLEQDMEIKNTSQRSKRHSLPCVNRRSPQNLSHGDNRTKLVQKPDEPVYKSCRLESKQPTKVLHIDSPRNGSPLQTNVKKLKNQWIDDEDFKQGRNVSPRMVKESPQSDVCLYKSKDGWLSAAKSKANVRGTALGTAKTKTVEGVKTVKSSTKKTSVDVKQNKNADECIQKVNAHTKCNAHTHDFAQQDESFVKSVQCSPLGTNSNKLTLNVCQSQKNPEDMSKPEKAQYEEYDDSVLLKNIDDGCVKSSSRDCGPNDINPTLTSADMKSPTRLVHESTYALRDKILDGALPVEDFDSSSSLPLTFRTQVCPSVVGEPVVQIPQPGGGVADPVSDSEFLHMLGIPSSGDCVMNKSHKEGKFEGNVSCSLINRNNFNLKAISKDYKEGVKEQTLTTHEDGDAPETTPEDGDAPETVREDDNIASDNTNRDGDKEDKRISHSSTQSSEFSQFTELDCLPFSQFELSEDFLSEGTQSSQGKGRNKAMSSYLIRRRSRRISSTVGSCQSSTSTCGSQSVNSRSGSSVGEKSPSTYLSSMLTRKPKNKSRRPSMTQQKKAAAVLSIFQFLTDKATDPKYACEFELPSSYDCLKHNPQNQSTGFMRDDQQTDERLLSSSESDDFISPSQKGCISTSYRSVNSESLVLNAKNSKNDVDSFSTVRHNEGAKYVPDINAVSSLQTNTLVKEIKVAQAQNKIIDSETNVGKLSVGTEERIIDMNSLQDKTLRPETNALTPTLEIEDVQNKIMHSQKETTIYESRIREREIHDNNLHSLADEIADSNSVKILGQCIHLPSEMMIVNSNCDVETSQKQILDQQMDTIPDVEVERTKDKIVASHTMVCYNGACDGLPNNLLDWQVETMPQSLIQDETDLNKKAQTPSAATKGMESTITESQTDAVSRELRLDLGMGSTITESQTDTVSRELRLDLGMGSTITESQTDTVSPELHVDLNEQDKMCDRKLHMAKPKCLKSVNESQDNILQADVITSRPNCVHSSQVSIENPLVEDEVCHSTRASSQTITVEEQERKCSGPLYVRTYDDVDLKLNQPFSPILCKPDTYDKTALNPRCCDETAAEFKNDKAGGCRNNFLSPVTPVASKQSPSSTRFFSRKSISFTSTPKPAQKSRLLPQSQLDLDIVSPVSRKQIYRGNMHNGLNSPDEHLFINKISSPISNKTCSVLFSPNKDTSDEKTIKESNISALNPEQAQIIEDTSLLPECDESYPSPAQIQRHALDLSTSIAESVDKSIDNKSLLSVSHLENTYSSERSTNSLNKTSIESTPWKKLARTAVSPAQVLESQDSVGGKAGSFSFTPRRCNSKANQNSKNKDHSSLRFSGCFQSDSQDAVVSLLCGSVEVTCPSTSKRELQSYIVSVQATSLTVWGQDSTLGWISELYWQLDPETHILKASLMPGTSKVALVVTGWSGTRPLASLFTYIWDREETNRVNFPLDDITCSTQIQVEPCPVTETLLFLGVTTETSHSIMEIVVTADKDISHDQRCFTSSLYEWCHGRLLSLSPVRGESSAILVLSSDQRLTIWSRKSRAPLKSVLIPNKVPCFEGLLSAETKKGVLLVDVVWRIEEGTCGGLVVMNPLNGLLKVLHKYYVPNNTWRRIASFKKDGNFVTALNDRGALSIWNSTSGRRLGSSKWNISTCASVFDLCSNTSPRLIVGEIYGCLHVYCQS